MAIYLVKNCILENYTWNVLAQECALSRFYRGIHFYSSNTLELHVDKFNL